MKNKKWVRFVESFIILPGLTMSGTSVGVISQAVSNVVNTPSIVFSQKQNTADLALNDTREVKAKTIDAYFKARNMPLEGTGMKMVIEAEKNDLDWRLLPAIAIRESSGGKFACKTVGYNSFGWGSCKIGFNSNDEAIETVALNLGGNNPSTVKYYGGDKTIKEILHAYNPPSIVRRYAEQVISIMNSIGDPDEVVSSAT